MNDVLLQKKASIERCVEQIRHYYRMPSDQPFETDFLKQDAIAMNLQRACECAIDMANYTIRQRKLGLPGSSRESFDFLHKAGLIDKSMRQLMSGMIGFRNVLVHDYQRLDLAIIQGIVENRLEDLIAFAQEILRASHDARNHSD